MSQFYSDPEREKGSHTIPNCEVFYMDASDFLNADDGTWMFERMADAADREAVDYRNTNDSKIDAAVKQAAKDAEGWYWWPCFPGCLPDSEPCGPFKTEQEAIDDARENID